MTNKLTQAMLLLMVFGITSCSSTKIVEHWKDPEHSGKFADMLVLSLNHSDTRRRVFETGFDNALEKRGIKSTASYELIPNHDDLSKDSIKAAITGTGIDGVLVMRQVKVKKEDRYVPPRVDYVGDPFYGSFYGYYGAFAPIYTPGYVTEDTTVHLETNVYAVDGEKLVWTGKTESFNPSNVDTLINELVTTILGELSKDGMI